MVSVTGVLKSPLGVKLPYNALRFTTVDSEYSLTGVEATTTTGLNGDYEFTLEAGIYMVEVLVGDAFTKDKYIEVPVDLSGTIALSNLMFNYEWVPIL